ncbi:copper resistance CopC family protein [Timonella sp. A28]|uniref:copper resistance CopC family protein n=1 Tax=Timonella sp. A28 TaxID=3442640 RepID=UPI003EBE2C60
MPASFLQRFRATRTPLFYALFAALTAAFFALGQASAFAHDVLIDSNPKDGDTLTTAPKTLSLEFNNPVQELGGQFIVKSSDGTEVASDAPASAGRTVTFELPELTNDTYSVAWRVVSSDSHPIEGALTFTVDDPNAAQETTTPTATSSPTETAEATPTADNTTSDASATTVTAPETSNSFPLAGVLIGGGLGLLAGIVIAMRQRAKKNAQAAPTDEADDATDTSAE